jgi:hypothetical protein
VGSSAAVLSELIDNAVKELEALDATAHGNTGK